MAIDSLEKLIAAFPTQQRAYPVKYGATNYANTGMWNSSWIASGSHVGSIPASGSGQVCNGSTPGRLQIDDAAPGNQLYLSKFIFSPSLAVGAYLMDRLVATSGLSGTDTTDQTVNSVALPARGNNGEGTELWLEWYVTTGSTARTVTVTYTNSAGVSGRVTTVNIPISTRITTTIRVPLLAGDRGVRSVQTVKLSASTGTAGNFGITINKRIATVENIVANAMAGSGPIGLNLPPVPNDNCLYIITNAASTVSATFDTEFTFVEG